MSVMASGGYRLAHVEAPLVIDHDGLLASVGERHRHRDLPPLIRIADLDRPDWGDVQRIEPDELPVFWACGVTPQSAIQEARPEICITHTPGHMLITDLPSALGSTLETAAG